MIISSLPAQVFLDVVAVGGNATPELFLCPSPALLTTLVAPIDGVSSTVRKEYETSMSDLL